MRTVSKVCALGIAVAICACGAKRDPILEKRARLSLTRHDQELAKSRTQSPATVGTTVQPQEQVKSYSNADIERIMATVGGEGPNLLLELRTQTGTIKCQLDEIRAPQTVTNFVGLATGQVQWRRSSDDQPTRTPFYDGLTFHRAVANFVIQTGNPGRRMGGGPGWTLVKETGANGAFEKPGALSMVDAGDDSHGSQFFITVRPSAKLAERYSAFGTCDNIDLVTTISNQEKLPKTDAEKSPSRPKTPVKIFTVKIYRGD